MSLLKFSEHWSLRTRLTLVAVLSLVMGILPSGMLLRQYAEELGIVAEEQSGLPSNRAWQAVLSALQEQRVLGAEALSTRPEAKPQALQAGARTNKAIDALEESLGSGSLGEKISTRQRELIQPLRQQQAALLKALADGPLDAPKLLGAHAGLASTAFEGITALNADTGLLLDPEAASYFAIVAGLQAAPRVQDALSELAALAR